MESLFIKYLKGEMTPLESGDFLRKVKSDTELKNEFIRFQNVYSITSLVSEDNDDALGKANYERFIFRKKQKLVLKFLLKASSVAASVAIITVLIWTVASNHHKSELLDVIAKQTTSVNAPSGQRAVVTLADSSVVWLNSKSQLTYPSVFTNERNVQLTGEALFEVSTNPDKPFIVTVGNLRITALGTKFNILAYPENDFVQVALLEGKVRVIDQQSRQEITLDPHQQVYCKDGQIVLSELNDLDYFLWKDGIYSFSDAPMSEIIKKLEYYYNVEIIVKNPSILNVVPYTGKFRYQDGVEVILNVLQKKYPFKITKEGYVFILK